MSICCADCAIISVRCSIFRSVGSIFQCDVSIYRSHYSKKASDVVICPSDVAICRNEWSMCWLNSLKMPFDCSIGLSDGSICLNTGFTQRVKEAKNAKQSL